VVGQQKMRKAPSLFLAIGSRVDRIESGIGVGLENPGISGEMRSACSPLRRGSAAEKLRSARTGC
jgi:hypothetical protein